MLTWELDDEKRELFHAQLRNRHNEAPTPVEITIRKTEYAATVTEACNPFSR